MGNRYGARGDEFAWNVGEKRRLKRYLLSGLSHGEAALLLGTSRGSVSYAAATFGIRLTVEQQRDMQARQSWERASHGRRSPGADWESKLIETWEERKRRLAKERAK